MNDVGLSTKNTQEISAVLRAHPEVDQAILYGSRAKGTHKPFSDIDLTLVGGQLNLNTQQKIEMELEELLMPYRFDISVHHLIADKKLLEHISRVGLVFYEKATTTSTNSD